MKRAIIMLFTLLVLIVGCAKEKSESSSNSSNNYNNFWNYFNSVKIKAENIENLTTDEQKQLLNGIQEQLAKIDPNLSLELSGKNRELVITAGGIKGSFSEVEKLVSSAPKDLEWKVTAFKPRIAIPFSLKFDDSFSLDTDKIFFNVEESGNYLNIHVYFEGQEELQELQIKQVIYGFLDGIIGEYDTETYIGAIESGKETNAESLNAENFLKRVNDFKEKIKTSKTE
ncbi:MAG: hypothetical protein KBF12_00755 [Sebaldella sp.]|nr:hypothetical protein [Sebaldella sp.]